MRVVHIAAFCALCAPGAAAADAGGTPAAAARAGGEVLVWTRMCGRERGAGDGGLVCFTGSAGDRLVAAAVIELEEDPGKVVFRVAVPGPVQVQYGARLTIDHDTPLTGGFFTCYAGRCVTDREATPELLAKLKAGRTLRVEAVGLSGTAVSFELPLSEAGNSFRAAAEAAPATDPGLFDERQKQLLAFARTLPGSAVRGQASVYSPWEKYCGRGRDAGAADGGEVCFTGRDARSGDGRMLFAAALIEAAADHDKLFRVNLPGPLRLDRGVRLAIDHDEPIAGTFFTCYTDVCMADYKATPEFVARLKAGSTIAVTTIDLGGRAVSVTLPLSDPPAASFASAYEGPAVDPDAFVQQQKKLQEDLRKRAEEMRRNLEAGPSAK